MAGSIPPLPTKYDNQKFGVYLNRGIHNMKKDLVGERFGSLVVERFNGSRKIGKSKHREWLCKCDCGKETLATTAKLNYGHRTSCGCRPKLNVILGQKKGSLHHGWKGFKNISGAIWNAIVQRAKRAKMEFDVTIEYAQELFDKQNHRCAISGLPIVFAATQQEFKDGLNTASLDRIDSSKGYTKDNVQWVHKWVNLMKLDFPQDEFIILCHAISNHQHALMSD